MPSFINAVFCLRPHPRGQTALLDAFRYFGTSSSPYRHVLVSWPGELHAAHDLGPHDRTKLDHDLSRAFLGTHLEHVSLPPLEDANRWRYFAEHELYPVLHSKQPSLHDYGNRHRTMWTDYVRFNEAFAAKIAHMYRPGDIVCIHDYHLCLVPAMLREKVPHAVVGFFLNTPFPSSEFVRCLIAREKILDGMLGSSTIFFQTEGYCRSFKSCCKRLLNHDTHDGGIDRGAALVAIEALPIGINVVAMEEQAFRVGVVHKQIAALRRQYAGRHLIVSTDRLESTRCVPLKLLAFERLLEKNPHWHEKVAMVHWISPTRVQVEVDEDAHELSNRLSALVQRINGRHGSLAFAPVRYAAQHLSTEELVALFQVADVGLFTSARDSMSRNALAYVICQRESHGPLILSAFSGTADNIEHAIKVNPWHLEAVADALDSALNMSAWDRKDMHGKMYEYACENTVQDWADKLIERLSSADVVERKKHPLAVLDCDSMLDTARHSNNRLVMLDYDGTLTPIVRDPAAALPGARVMDVLRSLVRGSCNHVWIISGRSQAFLETHLGTVAGLGLVAEHGGFIRHPHETTWMDAARSADMSWRAETAELMEEMTLMTPGAFLEHKKMGLTWHHRQADADFGPFMADELCRLLEERIAGAHCVSVVRGKKNVEVRPSGASKGAAATKLMRATDPDFVLCAGDDTTDEDMFGAVNDAAALAGAFKFCCRIGGGGMESRAGSVVASPDELVDVLERLAEV